VELWPLCSAVRADASLIVDGLLNPDIDLRTRVLSYLRLGQAARYGLQFPQRNRMMTDPASAIKRGLQQLVDLQIQTLRQPSSWTTSDLLDYRVRSKKLLVLYRLASIRRARFKGNCAALRIQLR
jgi:hypothetical protein